MATEVGDLLSIAVSAVAYWMSQRTVIVRWGVTRHPCDDVAWVSDVAFDKEW